MSTEQITSRFLVPMRHRFQQPKGCLPNQVFTQTTIGIVGKEFHTPMPSDRWHPYVCLIVPANT